MMSLVTDDWAGLRDVLDGPIHTSLTSANQAASPMNNLSEDFPAYLIMAGNIHVCINYIPAAQEVSIVRSSLMRSCAIDAELLYLD
jgi:hypothetical protein